MGHGGTKSPNVYRDNILTSILTLALTRKKKGAGSYNSKILCSDSSKLISMSLNFVMLVSLWFVSLCWAEAMVELKLM